jgi:hypothetical protein
MLSMRMAALFVFTTSAIGRSAGVIPRWFAYAGFAVGAFLLPTATLSPPLVLLFPVWVLVPCVLLVDWARPIRTDVRIPISFAEAGPLGAPRAESSGSSQPSKRRSTR